MEQYVTFETAKLLKEKGFIGGENIGCTCGFYSERCYESEHGIKTESGKEVGIVFCDLNNTDLEDDEYLRPTQAVAMRWLREVHGLHIQALCPVVDVDCDTLGITYNIVISNLRNYCLAFDTPLEDVEYNTYEEACESAIKFCLTELIK